MDGWTIIVAADDPAVGSQFAARVHAAWPHPRPLVIHDLDPADVEANLDGVEAVLLVPSALAGVRHLIETLEEHGVAIIVASDDPDAVRRKFRRGVCAIECDLTEHRLTGLLRGLMHRQGEVRRLRDELRIADRCHGGLQGEIARMHDELQLAAMVQREFLPRSLPSLYGVRFSALWRPANYVSGDIYDISRLDDDHIGVFIADAVGHGVPAALMTMVICRSLATKVISGSTYRLLEPAEVLDRLNRDMLLRQGEGRTTRFATAAYAVVNCRSRRMRLAGAGHPPPLLFSSNGASRELTTTGGLLGIFPDEVYDQIEVDLAVGDRLLLHSDGFEQAFPEAQADPYQRRLPTMRYREEFEEIVQEATPDDMIETLRHRLDEQSGSLNQADDVTLICMEAGPVPAATPCAAA